MADYDADYYQLLELAKGVLRGESSGNVSYLASMIVKLVRDIVVLDDNLSAVMNRSSELLEGQREARRHIAKLNDAFVMAETDKAKVRAEAVAFLERTK